MFKICNRIIKIKLNPDSTRSIIEEKNIMKIIPYARQYIDNSDIS